MTSHRTVAATGSYRFRVGLAAVLLLAAAAPAEAQLPLPPDPGSHESFAWNQSRLCRVLAYTGEKTPQ